MGNHMSVEITCSNEGKHAFVPEKPVRVCDERTVTRWFRWRESSYNLYVTMLLCMCQDYIKEWVEKFVKYLALRTHKWKPIWFIYGQGKTSFFHLITFPHTFLYYFLWIGADKLCKAIESWIKFSFAYQWFSMEIIHSHTWNEKKNVKPNDIVKRKKLRANASFTINYQNYRFLFSHLCGFDYNKCFINKNWK